MLAVYCRCRIRLRQDRHGTGTMLITFAAVVSTAHLAADGCVEGSLGPSAGAGGQGCQSAYLLEHLSSLTGVWDSLGVGWCCL